MVLNSHGGNNFKALVRELGLLFPEMFLCVSEWFRLATNPTIFENPGDHAGEMETSLILHLAPQLVLDNENWGEGKEKKNTIGAFGEGWVWTERPWSKVSTDTGIGNPEAATAEKGKLFFNYACEKMAQLFVDISNTNINDLFK